MSVYSFCPQQIQDVLSTVKIKNKGNKQDLDEVYALWKQWIHKFSGCEQKIEWAITNGIHDAIIQQVAHKSKEFKKFYIFESDYKFYWHILQPYNFETIEWKNIDSIEPNSYIIVSQPNHIGQIHNHFSKLVEICRNNNSKIFLDCAFYGSSLETLDTSNPVYDAVAFSLSKNFHLGGLRAGIVFGDDLANTLTVPVHGAAFSYNYFNSPSVESSKKILAQFPADYITQVAKPIQKEYCRQNNLSPCEIWMLAYKGQTLKCITEEIKKEVQHELHVLRRK
jgi:hypothetical protein